MNRFEFVLVTLIAILVVFIFIAQIDIRKTHNEQLLHRKLQYEAFLRGEVRPAEWTRQWALVDPITPKRPEGQDGR
jgi:uncharacterized membrane protein